jgi:hypothetical protein
VIFDKTAPCPRDVLKCAGDREMKKSVFVYEEIQSFNHNEDEPLLLSTSSPD